MRVFFVTLCVAVTGPGFVHAQNYATYDQPDTGSISTTGRVERTFAVIPQPASTIEVDQAQASPVYEPYEPIEFDESAYQVATEPMPATLPNPIVLDGATTAAPSYLAPLEVTPQNDNFSRELGSPETFASTQDDTLPAEIGFQTETETSRLLLALEDTYASRVSALKVKQLSQRKAMLDQFEKDAADPKKVIGLAARMRTSLSELDSAHNALLQAEESQYMAATLKVLDAAPVRAQ